MSKLKCEKCGHEEKVPQHCGQDMHIEPVDGKSMLVCWMGPECGKQAVPSHCGQPMVIKS